MQCRSCMTVNPAGNRFCEQCGAQLQLACTRCGHDLSPNARFCGNCGHAAATTATSIAETAPKWGELKQATVLFADIVGSTELISQLDPEEAMALLRPAVLRMRHSVERFGGTVVRTLGDGVMALFGVPRALEGHALLACRAALHMQQTFEAHGDALTMRIGLHSGQVASDPSDAEDGRGGGAHGLTIHIASRVIGIAQPGGICLTEACRVAAGATCETIPLGPHNLKGIMGAMALHQLTGVRLPAGARTDTQAGHSSTFRGREREFALLEQALAAIRQGGSLVVGIAGEPGAGKSRLCQEFAIACRSGGIPVHEVRAQLYGHALPMQPILELFRTHFFGLAPHDEPAVARERIASRFASIGPAEADLAILNEFFGVGTAHTVHTLGPRARQARLVTMLKELLRAEAAIERVILIEDLHWLDEASEEFVSVLVEAVAGTRTLLVLNYRPTYRAPWSALAHFEQIELAELAESDMDALVAEALASATPSAEVRRLVRERAAGNPFFAEELARSLIESRMLLPDTGLPAAGLEAVALALPATVEAVIGARLDRIGEPEKTLLQMCAIIGKDIPLAVLERVASPLADQIQAGLDGLSRAGLILPQAAGGEKRFTFRHPLIQEVAYGMQFRVRRGQVHADVAVAMELYYADWLDEYAGLIGYHYEHAGEFLQAARYNARAAGWVGNTNPGIAIRHWRKVRELLAHVPRSDEADRLRVTAGGKVALLGWREGMTFDEVKPLIDDALAVANEGDDRLVPWLLTIEGRMLVASGGPADGYVDLVRKALLYIDVERDRGRFAMAHAFLSQAYAWAGLLREALAANDIALAGERHVEAYDREFIGFSIEQWVLGVRIRLLVRMGRFEEAEDCLERMLDLETVSTEPPVPGMARFGFIELARVRGDAALAERHAEDLGRVLDKYAATPYVQVFFHGYRALAAMVAGKPAEAAAFYRDALALMMERGAAREYESELLAGLAEARLQAGDARQAREHASLAIELALARRTRLAQCRARIVRSLASIALGGRACLEDAQADLAAAQALVEETGASAWAANVAAARERLNAVQAA